MTDRISLSVGEREWLDQILSGARGNWLLVCVNALSSTAESGFWSRDTMTRIFKSDYGTAQACGLDLLEQCGWILVAIEMPWMFFRKVQTDG